MKFVRFLGSILGGLVTIAIVTVVTAVALVAAVAKSAELIESATAKKKASGF